MNRWLCPTFLALAALPFIGCQAGLEAPGVQAATALREEDGRVAITVTLSCDLVHGMDRYGEGCHADGDRVCVSAEWYEVADSAFTSPIATAEQCETVGSIIGAQLVVTSPEPIPADRALNILVRADVRVSRVVIPNP